MRSAAVVMAAEYVAAGGAGGRSVVARALQRPDEPAELLGYWIATHGRNLPMPVKRGVADAVRRLYTERAALRYDGLSRQLRMADVIELTHPEPKDAAPVGAVPLPAGPPSPRRRRGRCRAAGAGRSGRSWRASRPRSAVRYLRERGPAALADAGFSWERLSGWLPGGMDAEAWEAVIPSMGVMALVRNLRNFDQAGISRGRRRGGHRQDRRPGRGGQGAAVPVPGVGGVHARAVGQLEAGARSHPRATRSPTSRRSTARWW